MLPSAEALHLRKVRKIFLRSLHKSFLKAVKAEERAADGRMKSPEAVTEQRRDTKRQTHAEAKFSSASWLPKFTPVAAVFGLSKTPLAERSPPLPLRCGRLLFACLIMHKRGRGTAAGLVARAGIAKPLGEPGQSFSSGRQSRTMDWNDSL